MNANTNMIAISTIAAAVAAVVVSFPALADEERGFRRGEHPAAVARHAPRMPLAAAGHARLPSRVVVERPVYQGHPPVVQQRPVVVHRPIVVERPVYVQRTVVVHRPAPVPVYYPESRPVYAYAPAPVHYDPPEAYPDGPNAVGAIAGAVIGGVIGSQVGDDDSRGMTTVIGAVLGGLIGNRL